MPARPEPGSDRLPDRWDVEKAVKADETLPPIAAHLLLTLCTYLDPGSTVVPYRWSPSITRIEKDTGWSRRTITRWLQWLEDAGWLARIRPARRDAQVNHARTAYTLIIPSSLGPHPPWPRDSSRPGLGPESPQARDLPRPGLGPSGPEARDSPAHYQTSPDQPDPPDPAVSWVIGWARDHGHAVSPDWAAETVRQLMARPGAAGKDPLRYVRRTLATDPQRNRWLPTPQPPPYQKEDS